MSLRWLTDSIQFHKMHVTVNNNNTTTKRMRNVNVFWHSFSNAHHQKNFKWSSKLVAINFHYDDDCCCTSFHFHSNAFMMMTHQHQIHPLLVFVVVVDCNHHHHHQRWITTWLFTVKQSTFWALTLVVVGRLTQFSLSLLPRKCHHHRLIILTTLKMARLCQR